MKIYAALLLILISLSLNAQNLKVRQLPCTMTGDRFFLKIPCIHGDTILGFCDTGGGFTALYPTVVERLKLASDVMEVEIGGSKTRYIPASAFIADQLIPFPAIQPYYKAYIRVPFFVVPAMDGEINYFIKYVPHDAFLGQFFFSGLAWTFDYGKAQLSVNTPLYIADDMKAANMQILGFRKNRKGSKIFAHPRMHVEVDGKRLDMLFDTGASILPSESTKTELGITTASMGGSFIATSIFDKWRKDHPEWKYIEKGEVSGASMIEVPIVKVGNLDAGPVWFAKRPDEAWSKGMRGSMDKVVKGAIGGSFLKYFKVTIDYSSELIKFEKNN